MARDIFIDHQDFIFRINRVTSLTIKQSYNKLVTFHFYEGVDKSLKSMAIYLKIFIAI